VFVGALAPVATIAIRAGTGRLGADPIAEALNQLGLVALIFLVASLACSPLQRIFRWKWPARLRRELGLFAFFYALAHVSTYAGIDQSFGFHAIFADVTKRPFIFVGFAAFVILIPLAATSTGAAVRRLGFVRWKRLHRLAYVAGGLGAVHFLWRVKRVTMEPLTYAAIVGCLLLLRLVLFRPPRASAPRSDGAVVLD
jgi:sulfoxide reductase heme-binding subunit YedZ